MNVEERFRTALREGAHELDMHGRGPEAARTRGRRRHHRRRTIPAAVAATLTGVGIIAYNQLPQHPGRVSVASPGLNSGATGSLDATKFAWRSEDASVTQRQKIFVGSDGAYYALATAPGTRSESYPKGNVPQAVYRSTDGATWKPTTVDESPWISDLGERKGVLYAIGTAPGTASSVRTRVGASSDGGATWDTVDLPSDAHSPNAAVPLSISMIQPHIAVRGDTMVATLRTNYWFDPDALMTDAERSASDYAAITDAGVEIMKSEAAPSRTQPEPECTRANVSDCKAADQAPPVRTVSWSQLGVTRDQLTVDEMFVSNDGRSWHPVETPAPGHDSMEISATPSGFFLATNDWTDTGATNAALFRSDNGTTWQRVTSGTDPLGNVGVVGTHLVAILQKTSAEVVSSADGGTTWATTDLRSLLPRTEGDDVSIAAFDSGPLGAAVVVQVTPHVDDGAKAAAETSSTTPPTKPQEYLLMSADGASWSVAPLASIVGDGSQWVDWIAVGRDNVVLTVTKPSDSGSTSSVYVGTPTR